MEPETRTSSPLEGKSQLLREHSESSSEIPVSLVAVSGGEYKVAEPSATAVAFFANDEGVIHVFDFGYDVIQKFKVNVGENNTKAISGGCLGFGIVMGAVLGATSGAVGVIPAVIGVGSGVLSLHYWYSRDKQNTIDSARAKHVAITRDGIRFVDDTRKTGCRMNWETKGKMTKTIPFDQLTDCDIQEPAGASGPICCTVDNVLTKINIDTASSSGGHELVLEGLVDPHGFKSMVWRMKRNVVSGGGPGGGQSVKSEAPAAVTMTRSNEGNYEGNIVRAMNRQNKLLDRQNELLERIAKDVTQTSALLQEVHGEHRSANK